MTRYYISDVVCGHVGKSYYIIKSIALVADNLQSAAYSARFHPRVKHDYKYAVLKVREVSYEEYRNQLETNKNDPYFSVRNIQEQRLLCPDLKPLPLEELDNRITYPKRHKVSQKKYVNHYLSHD